MRSDCQPCVEHLLDSNSLRLYADLLPTPGAFCGTIDLAGLNSLKSVGRVKNCSHICTDWESSEMHVKDDHKIEKNFSSLSSPDPMCISHGETVLWSCHACNRDLILEKNSLRLSDKWEQHETRCEKCDVRFPYLHFAFACFRCRRAFVNQVEAMDHVANKCKYRRKAARSPTQGKPSSLHYYLCDYPFCGAQFKTRNMITKHFHNAHVINCTIKKLNANQINRLIKKGPMVCNICDAEIFNGKAFVIHMKHMHGCKSALHCPKCQSLQNKNHCKAYLNGKRTSKVVEYKLKSHHAQKCGDDEDSFVKLQENFSSEESKAADSLDEALLGELQDMHVSSTEIDMQDEAVGSLIGISEFCLRGEIPHCDIDCQTTPGTSDSKLPVNCNQNATDGTGHQLDAQLSHGGSKEGVLESNIFNKLFSDLLMDSIDEYDNGTQPSNANTNLNNPVNQTSSEKSDYYASNCTSVNNNAYPLLETGNFADNQASQEQQNTDVSIVESVLSLPKRAENQLSGMLPSLDSLDTPELAHSNQLRLDVDGILESESCQIQSLEEPCLESKDTKLAGTVQQDNYPFAKSDTVQRNVLVSANTGLDHNDMVSQSDLWDGLLINEDTSLSAPVCSSTTFEKSSSFKVISRVSIDTTNIDKNSNFDLSDLECGDSDISFYRDKHSRASSPVDHFNDGSDELEKILEYQPVAMQSTKMDNFSADSKGTDAHANASEVRCNTVQGDDSELFEGTAPSQMSASGLQTAGTSTGIHIEESERLLSCTGNGSGKVDDAGNFVSSQRSIVKNGSNANRLLEVSQTSSIEAKDFCDMNNNKVQACTLRSKQCCKSGNFEDKEEVIHSNDSRLTESHDTENLILSQVPEDNSQVEDRVKNAGCQERCSEILKEGKYPVVQSKPAPSKEEITNVLPQENYHCELACISQYDSKSTPLLEGIDCDSDIRPELEIDIISAIQSYMAKNRETMEEDHDSTEATNYDMCSKKDVQHVKVDTSSTNSVHTLTDTSTACAAEVTKENSYHKNMHVQQSSQNNKMPVNSLREPSEDFDISSSVLYEDWMPEKPLGCVNVNQKQVERASGLSIKNTIESHVRAVNGNSTVDKPTKYLKKNASKLSSDQIRMQLKKQNGTHISPEKINPSSTPMPGGVNSVKLSGCSTITLSNNASAKGSQEVCSQAQATPQSYGKTPTTDNTLTGNQCDDNLCLCAVTSVSTVPVYYSSFNKIVGAHNHETSRRGIGKLSPNKSACNDIIPLNGTIEREVPQWESLLNDCSSSFGNDTHLISSSQSRNKPVVGTENERTIKEHRKEKHRNKERKKLRRKQIICDTIPQPLFEFHKLSRVASKKETTNLGNEGKLLNTAIVDQSGSKKLDIACYEGHRSLIAETVKPSKGGRSLELINGDALLGETKKYEVLNKQELMTSPCAVKKRKGVFSEISSKCKVMRQELSTESSTNIPKELANRTISNKTRSNSFRDRTELPLSTSVYSNTTVHLKETSESLSECTSDNAKITPRFMRVKSHDENLEGKLEQSLLCAQKHITPPEKCRACDSDMLKTICSTEYDNLFKSDLDVSSRESTVVDSDEGNEDEVLERKISEKKAEFSRLLNHIKDVKTKIASKRKNGLLKQSLRARKRYLTKRQSILPTGGKRLLKRRFKDINTNAAGELNSIIKNSKAYHKLNKFETKRLNVHLGKMGLQEASREHFSRTWYCRDCSVHLKIRPCAVFLSRC